MAELAERSHLTPQVCGSNPVVGKKVIFNICSLLTILIRRKNEEIEATNGPFTKKSFILKHSTKRYFRQGIGTVVYSMLLLKICYTYNVFFCLCNVAQ